MHYLRLTSTSELPDLPEPQPFKAILIIEDTLPAERRAAISRWLLRSGCVYLMAWGEDCLAWQSAAEFENREEFAFGEIPDARVVIATAHPDESLEEVFWFSKYTAMHPCCPLDDTVLLHLSPDDREREFIEAYKAT